MKIKQGPIIPQEIALPYERIQDVSVNQTLLDRMFGLYYLRISNASFTNLGMTCISGFEKESAEGLRNRLINLMQRKNNSNKQNNPGETQ